MIMIIGTRCSTISLMSDSVIVGIGDDMFITGPWFVVEYKYNEYATVINLISLSGIMMYIDCLMIAVIKKISLIKLILGGAAMFAQQNINHQNDSVGITVSIPFVNIILRVEVIL